MKNLIAWCRETINRMRERSALEAIARRHKKWGHPAPFIGAMREVHLRAELELFRDFANELYLAEPDIDLGEIKSRWAEHRLKPMARLPGGYEDAAILRDVIREMPIREMLHGAALKLWESRAHALHRSNLEAQRKRSTGPWSPEASRILRSR